MKTFIEPEVTIRKFVAENVMATSSGNPNIGGEGDEEVG